MIWNEHVPDPDNPDQPRQIDVLIRRGAHVTHVECRIQKARQNVKWIEELIGRRVSLAANSVIGVSSSGFTKGAVRKATKYGIPLRDLRALTDAEVAGWGQSVALSFLCFQYSDLTLSLWVDDEQAFIDGDAFRGELAHHPVWVTVFNQAGRYLADNQMMTVERVNTEVEFGILGEPEGLLLAGRAIRLMEFRGRARTVEQAVKCPRIESYAAPTSHAATIVERFDLGETSVVHDGQRVAILLDISTVDLPPLCQFQGIRTAGEQEIDIESFELVGAEKLTVARGHVNVRVGRYADYVPRSRPTVSE